MTVEKARFSLVSKYTVVRKEPQPALGATLLLSVGSAGPSSRRGRTAFGPLSPRFLAVLKTSSPMGPCFPTTGKERLSTNTGVEGGGHGRSLSLECPSVTSFLH